MTTYFDGTSASLIIRSITKEYTGSYTVEVTNEFGTEQSSADVTVLGDDDFFSHFTLKVQELTCRILYFHSI